MVAFRFVAWVIVAIALMLLGADVISSLEGDDVVYRTLAENIAVFGGDAEAWAEGAPSGASQALSALFKVPGWLVFGVIGGLLALIFRPMD